MNKRRVERGPLALEDRDSDSVWFEVEGTRYALSHATLRWLTLAAAPVFLATGSGGRVRVEAPDQAPEQPPLFEGGEDKDDDASAGAPAVP